MAKKLQTATQLLGILAAFLSTPFFLRTYTLLSHGSLLLLLPLALGAYSLFVAYLAVMRFSPRAIRHLIIIYSFWLVVLETMLTWLLPNMGVFHHVILGSLLLILIAALIVFHNRVYRFVVQRAFSDIPRKINS